MAVFDKNQTKIQKQKPRIFSQRINLPFSVFGLMVTPILFQFTFGFLLNFDVFGILAARLRRRQVPLRGGLPSPPQPPPPEAVGQNPENVKILEEPQSKLLKYRGNPYLKFIKRQISLHKSCFCQLPDPLSLSQDTPTFLGVFFWFSRVFFFSH